MEKNEGNLANLINKVDSYNADKIAEFGRKAKERISLEYTWDKIADEYERLFIEGKK